ncbi:MAG TPA: sigma-70 family RNA polymerase sigma factor [Candidatus Dormibacteraeota bacterium]|nr:sigma-70 family RNA polymerase sigma factor [Candidatus Dormibacteraeota bacterium]
MEVTLSRDGFVAAVEGILDPAYRLATVMLLDFAAAEDAVHDATLDAWAIHRRGGGEPASFRTWFFAVVATRCRRMRLRRRLPFGVRGEAPEASDLVSDVLLHLGTTARLALFCRHWLGLPDEEVAVILGTTPNRVRDRIERAEERLHAELEQDLGVTIVDSVDTSVDQQQ